MPVVPFSPQPPKGRAMQGPVQLSEAQEPWALMAAAQMDSEGRLMHPEVEDRTNQTLKQRDNAMVDDQQLPPNGYGDWDKDTFGKLNKDAGSRELDKQYIDEITKRIERGIAARGS